MDTAPSEGKRPYVYTAPGPPHHQRLPHHHQPEQPVAPEPQPYNLPPPSHQPQGHPHHPSRRPSAEAHSAPHYPQAPSPYHDSYPHDPTSARNLPAPSGPPHGYGAARPPFAPAVEAPRQYASDPYRRPPSTPSQGNPPSDSSLRPIPGSNPPEAPRPEGPPMNHSQYPPGPSPEHPNGGYNGLPLSHHEHLPAPVSYAPHPYGPVHPPPTQYAYSPNGPPYSAGARKKQVRATQACDACRQRKQKCNEERPCAFCSELNLKCEYRDVPPPKQDRSMMQLMDKLSEMSNSQARLEELFTTSCKEWRDTRRRVEAIERTCKARVPEMMSNGEDARSPTMDIDVDTSRNRSSSHEPSSEIFPKTLAQLEAENVSPSALPIGPVIPTTVPSAQSLSTADELFVPTQHTTGAHNMLKWPILKKLINLDEILPKDISPKEQYPQQLEISRGLMKLYARGEGPKYGDRSGESPGTPSMSEAGDDAASFFSSASTDSTWGTGFNSPSNADPSLMRPSTDVGGLNSDGTLKLDKTTVRELYQSFLDNIWLMHPCIPKDLMQRLIKSFMYNYSHDVGPSGQSPFSINHNLMGPDLHYKKRKRSHGGVYAPGGPNSPESLSQRSRIFPERSIHNALVLLIMALGKISLHKGPIPPFPSESKDPSSRLAPGESPSNISKPSPGSATSFQSPNPDAPQLTPRSRTASTDGFAQTHQKDCGLKNFDVIPGLAYYAYATEILGNLQGGNDTPHAQAFILAAIYSAQLVRVMDSWAWLTQATRACQILVQTDRLVDDAINENQKAENRDPRQENIRFLYWTCLQLESDILAELDALSASGLYFFESKISYPKGVLADMLESPEASASQPDLMSDLMLFYSGQIQIRRLLNQLHKTNFYKQSERKPQGRGDEDKSPEEIEMEWEGVESREATYLRFTEYLDGWRGVLPQIMKWEEETDPLATDINKARARAKYYGARYVLNRPLLLQAILPYGVREKNSTVSEATIRHAAKTCVAAAIRSTVVFDGLGRGLKDRLITTNIFGTAHAQFGNCLLLAATYKSDRLSYLVKRDELDKLIDRTIRFLSNYEPHSPTLKYDKRILEHLRNNLDKPVEQSSSMSASTSFSSNK